MQLFTTSEAAAYLRLKERKLYELVAENAIPCTKITGRWLFPKDELDRWLAASMHRPEGLGLWSFELAPMLTETGAPGMLALRRF